MAEAMKSTTLQIPTPRGSETVFEGPRERIQASIASFIDEQLADYERRPMLALAAEQLRAFVVNSGKQIRPLLCYWGWKGARGGDESEVLSAAMAIELFHDFALIHDDIMDDSDFRRGRPSLHRAFASERRGVSSAILAGDLCFAWATRLIAQQVTSRSRHARVAALFHRMCEETIYGQYLDVFSECTDDSDELAAAMEVLHYKTVQYTIKRPLQIGASIAGAPPELIEWYSAFAEPVGEAFQLRDDLLGVFGNPEHTGKPNLDDLREGKRTVLIALAKQAANWQQARVIAELYGHSELDERQSEELRDIITATGARESVEAMIEDRMRQAHELIDGMPVTNQARQAFGEFCATLA